MKLISLLSVDLCQQAMLCPWGVCFPCFLTPTSSILVDLANFPYRCQIGLGGAVGRDWELPATASPVPPTWIPAPGLGWAKSGLSLGSGQFVGPGCPFLIRKTSLAGPGLQRESSLSILSWALPCLDQWSCCFWFFFFLNSKGFLIFR